MCNPYASLYTFIVPIFVPVQWLYQWLYRYTAGMVQSQNVQPYCRRIRANGRADCRNPPLDNRTTRFVKNTQMQTQTNGTAHATEAINLVVLLFSTGCISNSPNQRGDYDSLSAARCRPNEVVDADATNWPASVHWGP